MAQKTIIQLTDDIDGTELGDDGETVTFALDGATYEIDLSGKNADKLRGVIYDWTQHARKVGGSRTTKGSKAKSTGGPTAAEIRAWAKENNIPVPDRGRISAEAREAFEAR